MWSAGIQKRTGTQCSVRGARRLADRIREAKVPAGSRLVVSCVMAIVSLLYLDGEHGLYTCGFPGYLSSITRD